jgi:cytochrome b pre-mRNA-processing protein 3
MIFPQFRRNRRADTISALYGMIVAQARSPVFYRDFAVADTVNGRFDLLLLHVAVVVRRLMQEEPGKEPAQALFDRFCADMDDNLREMGVGDLSVPKHMKRVGEAFYGRMQAYDAALAASDDAALVEALVRNVYEGRAGDAARRLAAYIRDAAAILQAQEVSTLVGGAVRFPDPAAALREATATRG